MDTQGEVIERGVCHFTIEGEYLTRIARDLMLSERPDAAFRLLAQNLVGDGAADIAMKVLDGKMKYTGDSDTGINVEDEDPRDVADYLRDINYIYAGRVRIQGKWFRPKAWVSDFGPDDARWAMKATGRGVPTLLDYSGMVAFCSARVAHYCENGERVVTIEKGGRDVPRETRGRHVIFEPCSEPPVWWKPNIGEADAFQQFEAAGRRLEERSWSYVYGGYRGSELDASMDPAKTTETPIDIKQEAADLAEAKRKEDQRIAELEAEEAAEQEALKKRLEGYQHDIFCRNDAVCAQAGVTPFIELAWGEGDEKKTLKVPRAPFEVYALNRTALRGLALPYKAVCPSGMKLMMDDPYHTDWMVGAGLDLDAFYKDDEENPGFKSAVWDAVREVQHRVGNFQCAVLNDAGPGGDDPVICGKAVHPGSTVTHGGILILPDLNPKWLDHMVAARAVIAENGGAAAHLVQVARERGVTIVRVPGAVKKYAQGVDLEIDPKAGTVKMCAY